MELSNLLEVYTLEDILDYNNITVEEVIERLRLKLPEIKPLDFSHD